MPQMSEVGTPSTGCHWESQQPDCCNHSRHDSETGGRCCQEYCRARKRIPDLEGIIHGTYALMLPGQTA